MKIIKPFLWKGDVNKDGKVDLLDEVLIAKAVVGTIILTREEFLAADMNDDKIINSADLLLCKKKSVVYAALKYLEEEL